MCANSLFKELFIRFWFIVVYWVEFMWKIEIIVSYFKKRVFLYGLLYVYEIVGRVGRNDRRIVFLDGY